MALVAFGSQSGFSVRAGRASLSLSRFSLTLTGKSRDLRLRLENCPLWKSQQIDNENAALEVV